LLDVAILRFGWEIAVPVVASHDSALAVEWIAGVVLAVLLTASLWRGSGRSGWRELKGSFAALLPRRTRSAVDFQSRG
jgi:hypothetical protein